MDDLIAFLHARLDEDAAIAGAASVPSMAAHWSLDEWHGREQPHSLIAVGSATHPTALGHFTADPVPTLQAQHIARHDPARVLAEVDAKRQIIAQWEDVRTQARNPISGANYQAARIEQGALADVLRLFVACYADHPDYRDAWRP